MYLLVITWILMYLVGASMALGINLAICQFSNAPRSKLKAIAMAGLWFVTIPGAIIHFWWKHRQKLETMLEHLRAMQEMLLVRQQLTQLEDAFKQPTFWERADAAYADEARIHHTAEEKGTEEKQLD